MVEIAADVNNTQYIKVEQINSYLGAQVTGLDLSDELKNAKKIEFENKLAEFGVLVFKINI